MAFEDDSSGCLVSTVSGRSGELGVEGYLG
jgi:hypothetical protein